MPIIHSLLDTDFYKFTMGQVVHRLYPDVDVAYGFKNRTATVKLADFISEKELRFELDWAKTLRFTASELEYLRSIKRTDGKAMFDEDYLRFLSDVSLPNYDLRVVDGRFELEFRSPWQTAIYWETLALSIINELYYRAMTGNMSIDERADFITEGTIRLNRKIIELLESPHVKFIEFGTRRRFSGSWQNNVVIELAKHLPENLSGTSNVLIAMKHGLKPIGTMAHEMFMVCSALASADDEELRKSHNKVLVEWEANYAHDLLVALTDTFGTDFFFSDMTRKQAKMWSGLRQDSGNPIEFGEKAIAFYQRHGINPLTKILVFSDGLNVERIIEIANHFHGRINVLFGWGTNLTNDLGFMSLSLVVKATMTNGNGTVKLSDNLAKAMGAPEDIEQYRRVFGYDVDYSEKCVY
ncbi:MAG: nicotinate phosphoribosyltransferase [Patescibacteria group bacterium]|nr:nicotinate phosphoribosyltransferase [Patescibacteria group bacterium]